MCVSGEVSLERGMCVSTRRGVYQERYVHKKVCTRRCECVCNRRGVGVYQERDVSGERERIVLIWWPNVAPFRLIDCADLDCEIVGLAPPAPNRCQIHIHIHRSYRGDGIGAWVVG